MCWLKMSADISIFSESKKTDGLIGFTNLCRDRTQRGNEQNNAKTYIEDHLEKEHKYHYLH